MSAYKEGDPTTLNRLYGRSQGKPLRASQQELIDKLLPQIAVPDEGPVTSQALFGFDRPLHFEIGFGGGEHMAERADLLPDHGFIGAEPFVNGVAQALVATAVLAGIATPLLAIQLPEHTPSSELEIIVLAQRIAPLWLRNVPDLGWLPARALAILLGTASLEVALPTQAGVVRFAANVCLLGTVSATAYAAVCLWRSGGDALAVRFRELL